MDLAMRQATLFVMLAILGGCGDGEFQPESEHRNSRDVISNDEASRNEYQREQKDIDDQVIGTLNRALKSLASGDIKSAQTYFTKRGWRIICNSLQPELLDETRLADHFKKSSFHTAISTNPEFTITIEHRSPIGLAILEIDYTYKVSDHVVMICIGRDKWLIDSIGTVEMPFDGDLL